MNLNREARKPLRMLLKCSWRKMMCLTRMVVVRRIEERKGGQNLKKKNEQDFMTGYRNWGAKTGPKGLPGLTQASIQHTKPCHGSHLRDHLSDQQDQSAQKQHTAPRPSARATKERGNHFPPWTKQEYSFIGSEGLGKSQKKSLKQSSLVLFYNYAVIKLYTPMKRQTQVQTLRLLA